MYLGLVFIDQKLIIVKKIVSAWKMVGGKGVKNKVISEAEQVTV